MIRLKGKRHISPAFAVLAMDTACRKIGLLRHLIVAIQETVANANKCEPVPRLLTVRLASSPSYVFSKLDEHGIMKSRAALGQNRKISAMIVSAAELRANHIY